MAPVADTETGVLQCAEGTARLIEMIPFQSTVLLPPTTAFTERDALLGRAWSQTVASVVPALIADYGPGIVDHMLAHDTDDDARALAANVNAHPNAWPEARSGYGHSLQRRAAVQYWVLNHRQNVAVGLLEIATDAQAWNRRYRPTGTRLQATTSEQKLANAIQMVACLWLEDSNLDTAILLEQEIREDSVTRLPERRRCSTRTRLTMSVTGPASAAACFEPHRSS